MHLAPRHVLCVHLANTKQCRGPQPVSSALRANLKRLQVQRLAQVVQLGLTLQSPDPAPKHARRVLLANILRRQVPARVRAAARANIKTPRVLWPVITAREEPI